MNLSAFVRSRLRLVNAARRQAWCPGAAELEGGLTIGWRIRILELIPPQAGGRRGRKRAIALGVVLLLLASLEARPAQVQTGVIQGTVSGRGGLPLSQALLVLVGEAGDLRRQTSSDARGSYAFSGLPGGRYRLEVTADGHLPEIREEIELASGAVLQVPLILKPQVVTLRQAEERGVEERNPNIFIRRVDLNALRDPLVRRGIEPEFLRFSAADNAFGTDLVAPIRQVLFVQPREGRRQLHVSLYESHESSALNARPFFNVGPLRPSKRNQFGFDAGGPVLKDRLFFVGSLEFVRESGFVNGNIRAPLPDERIPTARDPQTAAIIAALLEGYPAEPPNLPSVSARQLNTNALRRIESTDWNLRLDYPVSESDSLAFQYTLFDYSEDPFELVAGQNPKTDLRPQTFSSTHLRSWSAGTLTQSSFHFDRLAAQLLPTDGFSSLLVPLGLEEAPDVNFGGSLSDLTGIGPGTQFPRRRFQNRFSGNFDLAHQRGPHRLRFGGTVIRIQLNDLQSNESRGTFSFTNNFGRSPIENFLEGTPTLFTFTAGDLYRGFRNWEHALYLQDSYQIRPGFTLNLGVRYEIVTVPGEVNDQSQIQYRTDANNVAPQLALAWAPGEGRTVVRAGYGISFGHIFPGTYQRIRFNPPTVRSFSVQNPSLTDPLKDLQPGSGASERAELNRMSPDLVSLYSHQYNLLIQRQLSSGLFFQLGYIGNRTHKLMLPILSNRARPVPGIPATTATIDQRRPDPNYLRILTFTNGGTFYYDGLKLGLSRSPVEGLAFDLDYIFSKAISSTTGDFISTFNGEVGPANNQSTEDLFGDLRGPAIFDHRHLLILRYNWELPAPFTRGMAGALLQGWEFSGMTELRTGRWFGIQSSSDAPGFGNVDGEGGDRVNITNPRILGATLDDPDTSTTIFNPDFFNTDIPVGGRGNIAVRPFQADPVNNTNVALTKSFTLAQRQRLLQFRAEFLNLFNHPLFARPGDVFPADIFGKIVDTQNKGRVIRFTLKLNF